MVKNFTAWTAVTSNMISLKEDIKCFGTTEPTIKTSDTPFFKRCLVLAYPRYSGKMPQKLAQL